MSFGILERRRDQRMAAFLPIKLQFHDGDDATPGHLLDLSKGGASILTTRGNAASLGQHLDLFFETPAHDDGAEPRLRQETGVVVNVCAPERGISRMGVRFLKHPGHGSGLFDPIDTLSDHRKGALPPDPLRRWETARNFQTLNVRRPELATAGV